MQAERIIAMKKRRVILVTDGDEFAYRTIQYIAGQIGGRCISRSHVNRDHIKYGSSITRKAVVLILERSGYYADPNE
jgi:hypothetical protein